MIDPAKEFQKHSQLCQTMSRETFNPDDKAAWRRMADRWGTCAKEAARATEAVEARALTRATRRRKDKWAERQSH
jgi:hypothetical protein